MEKNKADISLRLLTLGDRAIAVEFGQAIELDINQRVMALRDKIQQTIQQGKLAGIVEMVPTYCSLLVEYNPLLISYDELAQTLQQMAEHIEVAETISKEIVEIPVVYGGEYGPDLVEVAEYHQLSPQQVIDMHTEPEYPVYMLGFVAGFPYLGGMNSHLATPRKASPRLKIEAGSVGIAGGQTGIYSVESPGGWQIIGRTPLKLYDGNRSKPVLLSAGQYVKFKPISQAEYKAMIK